MFHTEKNLSISVDLDIYPNCTSKLPSLSQVNPTKVVIMVFVGIFFVLFGLLGNVLVILAVVRHRHLHSVPHYLIANLAVADLLLSFTVVPFYASLELLDCWVWGQRLCDMWLSLDVLCCTASIFTLCVISVDRWMAISNPLRYPSRVTTKHALGAVLAVWVLSAAISVGPLFGWKKLKPDNDTLVCKVNQDIGYVIFSNTCSFYVPLLVILVMYCKVYVVAQKQMRSIRKGLWHGNVKDREMHHSGNVTQLQAKDSCGNEEYLTGKCHSYGIQNRLRKFSREMKAAKTLAVVVGCFVLCWLPFFLLLPISSFSENHSSLDQALSISAWFCYFNSCLNPIIYPCFSKDFRKAFINFLNFFAFTD
ncbi:alpha-1A adrenergic receptor-like [Trichomycterus rosablanca]|uniref:alpha-1A adrenergic receptor-like n=1 Tax=Trichomycterus rosablanca TaxID=2290929 RepID=UPI002F35434C